MHIRRYINGQGLVQFELVQMSTFSTDMACFGYEMHISYIFFCAPHLCALEPSAPLASPLLRLWPITVINIQDYMSTQHDTMVWLEKL